MNARTNKSTYWLCSNMETTNYFRCPYVKCGLCTRCIISVAVRFYLHSCVSWDGIMQICSMFILKFTRHKKYSSPRLKYWFIETRQNIRASKKIKIFGIHYYVAIQHGWILTFKAFLVHFKSMNIGRIAFQF